MVRRFFVPVFVAALILGVAPSPSFGLGAGEVRPRHRIDDHYRCMYRCEERGEWRPPPRRANWGSWPEPRPRPRPPARPSGHRPCWLFCGGGGWGHGGWGHGGSGPYWWCGPGPYYRHGWYGHSRPCRPGGHRPGWYDHDRYDRHRDRDDDRGYNAHRSHPRGRDF